ncbi:MAG: hypothetical protein KDD28_24690, partial [Phaeodactylibacter sp.]|nr:hypothetical protein [Phaeodactylibacter sp.]
RIGTRMTRLPASELASRQGFGGWSRIFAAAGLLWHIRIRMGWDAPDCCTSMGGMLKQQIKNQKSHIKRKFSINLVMLPVP